MTITGVNSGEVVFSRIAPNLVVTGIPSGYPLEVSLTYEERQMKLTSLGYHSTTETKTQRFTAQAYSGSYIFNLREVLMSLEPITEIDHTIHDTTTSQFPQELTVNFSAGSQSQSILIRWIPGYFGGNTEDKTKLFNAGFWWTLRPQNSYTYNGFIETLQLAVTTGSTRPEIKIYADIHFATSGKKRVTVDTITPAANKTALRININVSPHIIENLAISAGYENDQILAYDIICNIDGEDNVLTGERYILAPKNRNIRGWYFRNSLGAFQTVYSSGQCERALESETKTFIADRRELEIENISKETFSVDTGYIKNRQELNSWYEFLRSTERYIILSEHEIARIIVDESDSKKTIGEAASISFRCRMSKEAEGYELVQKPLENFSDGFV